MQEIHKMNPQLRRKMCASAGFTAVEVMFGFAMLVALPFLAIAIQRYKALDEEILPEQYVALQRVAHESCTGAEHLKTIASRGPILGKDFSELRDDLTERAEKQKAQNARAKIIQSAGGCA